MWIVNLGDRMLSDPLLPRCLDLLGTLGRGRVIVVPGGGAFAEQARLAQERWGFDNLASHNLAVLAMTQSALMLRALQPRLHPVNQDMDIRCALQKGHTALWIPLALLRQQPDELTDLAAAADTLALWLARRLHAERLIVLGGRSIDATMPSAGASHVEPVNTDWRFTQAARDAGCVVERIEHTDLDQLRDLLTDNGSKCWEH
ncbi:hypothetical protein [Azohydromonas australica]|uniref:hypothetical protein n=1 Tax=Azohydromonas australica TaxID=364039 RepID=UPI00048DF9CF|nr:hypothetical protein [Azohydromonas australica]